MNVAAVAPDDIPLGGMECGHTFRFRSVSRDTGNSVGLLSTSRQWAVGTAVGQAGEGLLPGHALGLVSNDQHDTLLVAPMLDGDTAGNRYRSPAGLPE